MSPRAARKLRCAVYTRKSSEEGLEQEFNSLHAQREAGLAYIASQRSEGWIVGPGMEVAPAVDFLNKFLAYDGWRLVRHGRSYVLRSHRDVDVEFRLPDGATADQMADFIREQVEKCQAKLAADDHDGAITNARSLIEAVLRDLEDKLSGAPQEYDGNLPRLYKRVQKAIKLDPADYQEMADVQQLLRGLTTIVDGLSGMSNELADRHAGRRRPLPHHARLAVNAANTLCSFLVDSYRRQRGQP